MEILALVKVSQSQGVSARRFCLILRIEHRRVVRWLQRMDAELTLENQKPGPKDPCHRLLPEEIDQIVTMAISEEYCDLSHRILAVTAWEKDMFHVSFSTVYHVLKDRNLMSGRSPGGFHNGNSKAPVRKVLTGANQRWCWDISYLMTQQKGQYLFLYLLLDEYSRKVIQWRISWSQTADESLRLLDGGFIEENILDLPEDQRPEIISDRGRQMKAKTVKRLCEDHHMPQLFARPRTPNDNPFIESAFSTVKRAPQYLGRFLDLDQANEYFKEYFTWYNSEHYHSGIDYVTPEQAHQGLRQSITERRHTKQIAQRKHRREENQKHKIEINKNKRTTALSVA